MMRPIKKIIFFGVIFFCGTFIWATWHVGRQGLTDNERTNVLGGKVTWNEQGIPRIEAENWFDAIEAQGFVVASERLWQMDLIRRRAAGRLSEWFGEKALPSDIKQRTVGFLGVANTAVKALPAEELAVCESYVRGVNKFIEGYEDRWGLEYQILRARPEPWLCRDTLLVVLAMIESMSGSSEREKGREVWRESIGEAWANVIFTQKHPWNNPLIDTNTSDIYPPIPESLPQMPIEKLRYKSMFLSPHYVGSNNWAYRGTEGWFLANDPHLIRKVPQTWYALKILIDKNNWIAGASLPGVPGVVLGMNQSLGWAFTNTGEDIDDLVILGPTDNDEEYTFESSDGSTVTKTFRFRDEVIAVGADSAHTKLSVKISEFGPIVETTGDGKYIARRWLATDAKWLGLPVLAINQSKDWKQLNLALDRMQLPAQNVVVLQRDGAMGYRTAGTGIDRRGSGLRPTTPSQSIWEGTQPPSTRPRIFYPPSAKAPVTIATANQRIWVDEAGHSWTSDDRVRRINEFLSASPSLQMDDMLKLQLDTHSQFLLTLRKFILARQSSSSDRGKQSMIDEWKSWNGRGDTDGAVFDDLQKADEILTNVLLSRLAQQGKPGKGEFRRYSSWMRRAWVLRYLQSEELRAAFGLSEAEIAEFTLNRVWDYRKSREGSYAHRNRWRAQHPFVGRIPLIGGFFKVIEMEQYSGKNVVRVETPKMGASTRMVWDLSDPRKSRWSFPVGQSGHIRSLNYRDSQKNFSEGIAAAVFSEDEIEKFGL